MRFALTAHPSRRSKTWTRPGSVTYPGLADALDPLLEISLVAALRLVNVKCSIDPTGRAGALDRDLPVAAQFVDKYAFAARL
jgi:hypothetical protein